MSVVFPHGLIMVRMFPHTCRLYILFSELLVHTVCPFCIGLFYYWLLRFFTCSEYKPLVRYKFLNIYSSLCFVFLFSKECLSKNNYYHYCPFLLSWISVYNSMHYAFVISKTLLSNSKSQKLSLMSLWKFCFILFCLVLL